MDKFIDNIFKDIDKNITFDDNQKKIIKYLDSNLLVVAGAGAGKTTTISAKVNFMINFLNIKSKEILVISFTNKAVNEIDDYINKKMKLNVDILTFHKLAKNIIETEGYRFKLIDNDDLIIKKIIKEKRTNEVIKFLWKKNKISKKFKDDISNTNVLTKYTIENIKIIKAKAVDINKFKDDIYLKFLKQVIKELEKYKFNNNLLNFDDLIYKAEELICDNNFKYKYIIIDEYQDISKLRYNLIKKIKKNRIIIAVGDDWQSIYSFAGSNLNLFLEFSKSFNSKIMTIENTYRNSQQLINIAGNFVMKNKNLIIKNLSSKKSLENPITYTKKENLEYIINYIIEKYGSGKKILLLGRYKSDINIINNNFTIKGDKITYNYNKDVEITFLTIHSSKGLGYDNVIILNNNKDKYGFPSYIKNDYFKKKYLKFDNLIDEERRLFYVALTRTKNEVVLLYDNKKSIFLKELKKEVKKLKIQ